ncbi:MAG: iron-containing alcohol dehydrogenase [Planctomycetia bacterium]|nr:iron-containing alcohol dehydrogenase [Planctomycetia bacterium]
MIFTHVTRLPIILRVENELAANVDTIIAQHNLHFPSKMLVSMPHLFELYNSKLGELADSAFLINNNSLDEVERTIRHLESLSPDTLVVAFGGGQVIDVAKCAAAKLSMNYLSVPTALSHDGICSPVAVLSSNNKRVRLGANSPLGILVDLSIIQQAPPDTLRSGLGDLISNQSALLDWKLGRDHRNELVDDFAYTLSLFSTQTIMALRPTDFGQRDFISRVAYGLVISGLAMEVAGSSRPCSGAEHAISHAIDEIFPARSTRHGLQVGAATVPMLRRVGKDTKELVAFMKKIGMPVGLRELGFTDVEIVGILTHARDMRSRFTVLSTVSIDKGLVERMEGH